MYAYEFATQVTQTGYVEIPAEYAEHIPPGSAVRVLILTPAAAQDDKSGVKEDKQSQLDDAAALEEFILSIKGKPSNAEHIHVGSGKLAEHLTDAINGPDPDFDAVSWNHEWAIIEAKMKAASLVHEKTELED
jgi:hypothetical protein